MPKSKRTFEQAVAEVEEIVGRLEGGKLELAQSLEEYQRGIGTLKECYELLSDAERRITLLSGFDADGNPVTEPFGEEAMTDEVKQATRSARRSAPSAKRSEAAKRGEAAKSSESTPPDVVQSDYFDDDEPQEGLF
jgi:exodeoxyribonuclease VII small subunit